MDTTVALTPYPAYRESTWPCAVGLSSSRSSGSIHRQASWRCEAVLPGCGAVAHGMWLRGGRRGCCHELPQPGRSKQCPRRGGKSDEYGAELGERDRPQRLYERERLRRRRRVVDGRFQVHCDRIQWV